jgi:hypothetical protein
VLSRGSGGLNEDSMVQHLLWAWVVMNTDDEPSDEETDRENRIVADWLGRAWKGAS